MVKFQLLLVILQPLEVLVIGTVSSQQLGALAFVFKNNIYFISDADIMSGLVKQLTKTGEKHKIFNGVPDWVYQGVY